MKIAFVADQDSMGHTYLLRQQGLQHGVGWRAVRRHGRRADPTARTRPSRTPGSAFPSSSEAAGTLTRSSTSSTASATGRPCRSTITNVPGACAPARPTACAASPPAPAFHERSRAPGRRGSSQESVSARSPRGSPGPPPPRRPGPARRTGTAAAAASSFWLVGSEEPKILQGLVSATKLGSPSARTRAGRNPGATPSARPRSCRWRGAGSSATRRAGPAARSPRRGRARPPRVESERFTSRPPVDVVAHHRVPDGLEMDADLVGGRPVSRAQRTRVGGEAARHGAHPGDRFACPRCGFARSCALRSVGWRPSAASILRSSLPRCPQARAGP